MATPLGVNEQKAANTMVGKVLWAAHYHGIPHCGFLDRVDSLGRSNIEVEGIRTDQAGTCGHLRAGCSRRLEYARRGARTIVAG